MERLVMAAVVCLVCFAIVGPLVVGWVNESVRDTPPEMQYVDSDGTYAPLVWLPVNRTLVNCQSLPDGVIFLLRVEGEEQKAEAEKKMEVYEIRNAKNKLLMRIVANQCADSVRLKFPN